MAFYQGVCEYGKPGKVRKNLVSGIVREFCEIRLEVREFSKSFIKKY